MQNPNMAVASKSKRILKAVAGQAAAEAVEADPKMKKELFKALFLFHFYLNKI